MGKDGLIALLTAIWIVGSLTVLESHRQHKAKGVAQDYAAVETVSVGGDLDCWSKIAASICPENTHTNFVGQEMKKLNPEIKDIHTLYPGQKIAVPKYE